MSARLRTIVKLWPLFISGALLLFTFSVFVDIGQQAKWRAEMSAEMATMQQQMRTVRAGQDRIGNVNLPKGDTENGIVPVKPPGKE